MKSYTVYEPLRPASDPLKKADKIEFVREGFSWLALLFPLPWMLYYRMWMPLLALLALVLLLNGAGHLLSLSEAAIALASLFMNLLIGFEGNNLRRWSLERQGYQYVGTVSADSYDECELKFFSYWQKNERDSADLTKIASQALGAASSGGQYRR